MAAGKREIFTKAGTLWHELEVVLTSGG